VPFILIKNDDDEIFSTILETSLKQTNRLKRKMRLQLDVVSDEWAQFCMKLNDGRLSIPLVSIIENINRDFANNGFNITIDGHISIEIRKSTMTCAQLKKGNYWQISEMDANNLAIDRF